VPDLKEMKDVFNTRIEMESMILSVLIDMPDLETRLQPLYAMIEQEAAASESGDRVGWNRLSNAFHVELARLLDNDVLFEIMNTLCARSSLIVAVSDPLRKEKRTINSNSHHEHREILDLLVAGKRNRVTKVMRRHLSACIERLEQKLEM
ncbi:GntR family transcriptional regulator, partial [Neisseria sp. P0021.S007]